MVLRWDDDPLCSCVDFAEPQFLPIASCTSPATTEEAASSRRPTSPILQRVRSRCPAGPDASPLAATLRADIVELRTQVGDRHPAIYEALNDAGRACFETDPGNSVDALAFYEEALALQRYYLGYAHVRNADTHYAMADVLKSKSLNQGVEQYATALGLYEFELNEVKDRSFCHEEEEWSRGIPDLVDANAVLENVLELQCKVASCLNSIGNIRFEQRRFDEASAQYRKSMTIIREAAKQAELALTSTGESIEVEAAGEVSDDSSSSDSSSSSTTTEVIEIVAGQRGGRNGVRVEITAPGGGGEMMDCSSDPGTPNSSVAAEHDRIHQLYCQSLLQEADTLHNLANLHGERGEWTEAIRHYNYALHLQIQQLGEDNSIVANTLSNIGTMNHRAGNLNGALKAYKQVAKMRKNCLGNCVEVADAIVRVALVQSQTGLVDKAENMYNVALRIAVKEVGENHIKVATIKIAMGDLYLQHRHDDERALQLYSDAYCILKDNELADDHFLLKSVTKKIMDTKFKEMGDNIGGAMSAFYEVMKAVGIDAMPAIHDTSHHDLGVSSLMDDMSKANVSLTAY
eukprot:CAMPEP_0181022242 /NCGR_PEP_ID=MMETSP1070-20121207/1410_1 /TAXON_ID=265543 /ORGANISM="Minutocellus polymorphus, Strain NH13" /LENGTH=573 /DNA_ID=CAMNT_0023099171 /DNA_START=154 /DNA_END=1875 /DNA_ORIENTATION=+